MQLETVIGLEVHVQLKTKSKMFCGCKNADDTDAPNTCVCEVCLAHPGTLPVPNGTAIEWAVKTALALSCKINSDSLFERKHYFYPDLPKGYQISQHTQPIAVDGQLSFDCACANRDHCAHCVIGIERLQLEEDTAKLTHTPDGSTLIDFNRAGTPLLEIVSTPSLRTPADAKLYLQELREIVRALGVSDAEMEKGQLRCDANISVRKQGDKTLNTKIEVKNLNSFRAVERALSYEEQRLSDLFTQGAYPVLQETRGWDDATSRTELQRKKEQAEDYRYFPDPDIPPFHFEPSMIERLRAVVPELPYAKRARFISDFGFTPSEAKILTSDQRLADYTEKVISELIAWVSSQPGGGDEATIWKQHGALLTRLVFGWLTSKLGGILAARNESFHDVRITPEDFAEFLTLIFNKTISSSIAQTLLQQMVATGHDPHELLETMGGGQVRDSEALSAAVAEVIAAQPKVVAEYRGGKEGAIMFLVGHVMRAMQGKADPQLVQQFLRDQLSASGKES